MVQKEYIRKLHNVKGLSIRDINRRTGHHRNTIKKYLNEDGDKKPKYNKAAQHRHPVLEAYILIIQELLETDKTAPKKQKLSGKNIYDILKNEHHYKGGYTTVTDYLRKVNRRKEEAYLPLEFVPGTHGEVDFGKAEIEIGGSIEIVHLFCMKVKTESGYGIFVKAYPYEKQEVFFDGHMQAFEMFGGIPVEIAYDNLKIAVKNILRGSNRDEQDSFIALKSHYLFEALFCQPGKGNEKGGVEKLVQDVRGWYLTPVPTFSSYDELNTYLKKECVKHTKNTSDWDKAQGNMLELPGHHFDCCRMTTAKVNTYSTIRFETNTYSVPTRYVGYRLTIKAYIDRILIIDDEEAAAIHERLVGKNKEKYELDHYLDLLEMKSRALPNTKVYDESSMPDIFSKFRKEMNKLKLNSNREFVRILKLLREYSLDALTDALELAYEYNAFNYDSVLNLVHQSTLTPYEPKPLSIQTLPNVSVQSSNLSIYNNLISKGGDEEWM